MIVLDKVGRKTTREVSVDASSCLRHGLVIGKDINVDAIAVAAPHIIDYILPGRRVRREAKVRGVGRPRVVELDLELVVCDKPRVSWVAVGDPLVAGADVWVVRQSISRPVAPRTVNVLWARRGDYLAGAIPRVCVAVWMDG